MAAGDREVEQPLLRQAREDRAVDRVGLAGGAIELAHVTVDRSVDLAQAPAQFFARVAPGLRIHGLELAAVDGDERLRKQARLAA